MFFFKKNLYSSIRIFTNIERFERVYEGAMTSSTTGLIGLEHLGPEPCDGTGDDPMSIRARRKWHVGKLKTALTKHELLNA